MQEEYSSLFPDKDALHSYFESVDRQLKEEIASRPVNLRLPHRGFRFRAVCDTVVDVVTYLRGCEEGVFLPIEIRQGAIPRGEIIRLDYEPDLSESTHCSLIPERYEELERFFVKNKFRKEAEYSGFRFSVPYLQLDKDFEWLERSETK
jgi:hypothetical protein